MSWLRHVIVDLLVIACVVAATLLDQTWAGWIVVIYTPLMLVLMALTFFAPDLGGALRQQHEVPPWFYHVLYGANVLLLTVDAQWWLAAGWAGIWMFSAGIVWRRTRQSPAR